MVLPAHPAAQAPALSALLEPLLLYLGLSEERGVVVSIDCHHYHPVPQSTPLCLLVQALLPAYPDLVVTHDPSALDVLPRGSVVLLCLQDETLTQDGRWLDLHRQIVEDHALRVVLWCEGRLPALLARAAPHFADWIAHHLVCPAALLQPPAHAVLGLRALVRARIPGALLSAGSDFETIVHAALPRWHHQAVVASSYESLLLAMQRGEGPRLLSFWCPSARDQRRLLWALAESGWRRPCLLHQDSLRPPGWWLLHDEEMPLARAIHTLSATPRPGVLAVLLGLEPEAIALCARLLAHGADAQALGTVLRSAPDPGAVVALQLAAMGQVDLEQVARGEASPPELRALACHPQVRGFRQVVASGDADTALRHGDVAVALHWAQGAGAAEVQRVEQAAREQVAQRTGAARTHLCLLHAPEDEAYARELAQLLRLMPEVREVSLQTNTCSGDVLISLLSADFFVHEPAYNALVLSRQARRAVVPVLLRPISLADAEVLRGLPILPPDQRAVTTWSDPDDAWTEVLRGIAARLRH